MTTMADYLISQTFIACFPLLFVILKRQPFSKLQKIMEEYLLDLFHVMDGKELEDLIKDYALQKLVTSYQNFVSYCFKTFISSNSFHYQ